ncbi:MAG: Rhodanese-related sulfurtransferase [Actinomycetia bacterium]|nr:Rhodanese-related sulfurtransferase [Actinomycetes bacterium]
MTMPEVEPEEAQELVQKGAYLLDVRETDEWIAGHAPDAKHVALGEVPAFVDRLPRDRQIVAVCRSGARSARATEFLVAQGFDVVNLAGGMKAWAATGLDVEADDGTEGIVA